MWIVNHRKFSYALSILLIVASIAALLIWGLKLSIDFSGGTLINITYEDSRPDQAALKAALTTIDANASVRPVEDDSFIIRMKPVSMEEKTLVMDVLSVNGSATSTVNVFDSVGPILGAEAMRKAAVSILLVIIGIVLFITFAFRKVSEPVSSWKYGLIAIVALIHDVIIPTGVFAVLGYMLGYEVDTLFVTALLVILGFSVHNTIVVFDRVRENLRNASSRTSFPETVGKSIMQTLTRSINTSFTTLIALVALYVFGGSSVQQFVLVLIIGMIAGTYSSIFIASPLLITIEKWGKKK